MRRVEVTEYQTYIDRSKNTVTKREAIFHQFGSDYDEYESGPGNFTTAIVEFPDGTIGNVPVGHVQFLGE